jgi:hypothetical protein
MKHNQRARLCNSKNISDNFLFEELPKSDCYYHTVATKVHIIGGE